MATFYCAVCKQRIGGWPPVKIVDELAVEEGVGAEVDVI
jgi:hypothetical protein